MTRERDRYRRASWAEQLREGALSFWRNRTARIVTAILLVGFLLLTVLTPEVVKLSALAVGDCIYLRPPGTGDSIGPQKIAGTAADLQRYDVGERASCDLSHSHEVSAVFVVGSPGDAYLGLDALVGAYGARCDAAFEPYVGRVATASRYATALAVPSTDAWRDGARYGVCLVFNADRGLLDHHARGSGE
jgi:Septum formation